MADTPGFTATGKASINRTHSKRFALAAESADHASALGVRASSAPLSRGGLRFDGRAGLWRASSALRPCIGTVNLVANAKRRSGGALQNLAVLPAPVNKAPAPC